MLNIPTLWQQLDGRYLMAKIRQQAVTKQAIWLVNGESIENTMSKYKLLAGNENVSPPGDNRGFVSVFQYYNIFLLSFTY
jgi:hypothetical protein